MEEAAAVDPDALPDSDPDVLAASTSLDRAVSAAATQAAAAALEDPAIAHLASISNERFAVERKKVDDSSRVTRGWLQSLGQREFFLAIGYPGFVLQRFLDGVPLEDIREWVNGTQRVPNEARKILMLEHMLDRRTLSNRKQMPSREKIELALSKLLAGTRVADILGGFEGCRQPKVKQTPAEEQAVQAVAEALVIRPEDAPHYRSRRPGVALPPSPRAAGKGRQMGQRLIKPSTYCYNISKRSTDKATGEPRLSPRDVMEYINKAADLEARYGVLYSMRRRDPGLPWMHGNIELLPTGALEAERTGRRADQ